MEETEGRSHRATNWFAALTRTGRLPGLLVVIACGIVLYGFLFSGDYAVDDVVVRGAQLGDPVEIASTSGAFGASIFEVEPALVAGRIAELPYVQNVNVETHWPSQVVVTVEERVPVIVWRTAGRSFLVDAHGQILAPASADSDLPVVESDTGDVEIGGAIDPRQVASVQSVYASVGPQLDSLTWSEREGLTAQLDDRSIVIFGYPERFPMKIAVYQDIGTIETAWSVLDLREPERPYYE